MSITTHRKKQNEPSLKTILFDWEGVVGPKIHGLGIADRLGLAGVNPQPIKHVVRQGLDAFMRGKMSDNKFWASIEAASGMQVDPLSRQRIWQEWEGATPYDDMMELIATLKKLGYQTAIFSNIVKPCEEMIRDAGHYDIFDVEILSCNVGCAKPQDAIYKLALEQVSGSAEECLFIDDKQENLITADTFGMHTILAASTVQIRRDLMKYIPGL